MRTERPRDVCGVDNKETGSLERRDGNIGIDHDIQHKRETILTCWLIDINGSSTRSREGQNTRDIEADIEEKLEAIWTDKE